MGRLSEAAGELERARALARDVGDVELVVAAHRWLGVLAYQAGDAQGAMDQARRAVEGAEKIGSPFWCAEARDSLALACTLGGDPEGAVAALEETLPVMRERRIVLNQEGRMLAHLAEAHLERGDADRARALAEEAIAVARARRNKLDELAAHLALVRVLLTSEGARARAGIEAAVGRALALVEETGARFYEPLIHVELARLARLTGDEAARQRELREAHRLFTEMGAPIRAEQVAKELGV